MYRHRYNHGTYNPGESADTHSPESKLDIQTQSGEEAEKEASLRLTLLLPRFNHSHCGDGPALSC